MIYYDLPSFQEKHFGIFFKCLLEMTQEHSRKFHGKFKTQEVNSESFNKRLNQKDFIEKKHGIWDSTFKKN